MWESVAKYMKKFRFKNTVHPKNVKRTFVFNDVSIHVVTSQNAAVLVFILPVSSLSLSSITSSYWEESASQTA